jgi:YggT family protein
VDVVSLISLIINLLTLLVILQVIVSYFVQPYHPVREMLDRIVEPMLNPIRRVMPPLSGLDFSPLVLILLIKIIGSLVISILIR